MGNIFIENRSEAKVNIDKFKKNLASSYSTLCDLSEQGCVQKFLKKRRTLLCRTQKRKKTKKFAQRVHTDGTQKGACTENVLKWCKKGALKGRRELFSDPKLINYYLRIYHRYFCSRFILL